MSSSLIRRNHTVTFITNQETPELGHYKTFHGLEEVVVPGLEYSMLDGSDEKNFFQLAAHLTVRSQMKIFRHLSTLVDRVIQATYTDPGVQQVLKYGKFDLLLLSQVVSYAGYPLAWHFGCPYILSSPNVLMTDSAYLLGDNEHTVIKQREKSVRILSNPYLTVIFKKRSTCRSSCPP